MSTVVIYSACITGKESQLIDVEVNLSPGLPYFNLVGLADSAVKESRQRVRSAIRSLGIVQPNKRITINLRPAWIKKSGSYFDLPIAIGLLAAQKIFSSAIRIACFGELSLTGEIKSSCQSFALIPSLIESPADIFFFPEESRQEIEAFYSGGIYVRNLKEVVEILKDYSEQKFYDPLRLNIKSEHRVLLEEEHLLPLHLQASAWRAATISVAGNHHILFLGSAGSGKTSIAKASATLLPDLEDEIAVEKAKQFAITKVPNTFYPRQAPFREIESTVSIPSLLGGSTKYPYGELTLADHGILFIDEINFLSTQHLNILRPIIQDAEVRRTRDGVIQVLPANFILFSAANPCYCGNLFERAQNCSCSDGELKRYMEKFQNPFFDRIDLFVDMLRLEDGELHKTIIDNTFNILEEREKVLQCRKIQYERQANSQVDISKLNGRIPSNVMRETFEIKVNILMFAEALAESLRLSIRQFHKLLRVARTIADLEYVKHIEEEHILEAFSYRRTN